MALIQDQFELFYHPRWTAPTGVQLRLEPSGFQGRFTLGHRNKDRLLQIQATRFHLNWRKREGFYPSYNRLIAEFEAMFAALPPSRKRRASASCPEPMGVDLHRRLSQGRNLENASRLGHVPAGLLGQLFSTDGLGIVLEHRAAEWSYEIQPKRGRLHIAADQGGRGTTNVTLCSCRRPRAAR